MRGSRNPTDIFLARRSLDYRDPVELRITRVRARTRGYGFCVRNDGHYAYRIRVTRTPRRRRSKYIRLRCQGYAGARLRVTRRSTLFHDREMQNAFFREIDVTQLDAAT